MKISTSTIPREIWAMDSKVTQGLVPRYNKPGSIWIYKASSFLQEFQGYTGTSS